jgi:DNA-binding NarL/FixJ family response regulator
VLRIVLVDDHAVMRQGLRRMLEDYTDLEVVGEAEDGLEALDLVRAEKPDVVLMDITLPRLSGIEATRHIMQELPGTIVIGLSFISDAQTTQALKDAGAYACVAKERAMVDIYRTIMEAVAERQTSAP